MNLSERLARKPPKASLAMPLRGLAVTRIAHE
jgi:hypothetical protein